MFIEAFQEGGGMAGYSSEVQTQMINLDRSLSEKDRRRYAVVEAAKLGAWGDRVCRPVVWLRS